MEAKHTQAEEEFKDAVSHLGNLYEEAKDSLNSLTIIKHEGLYYNQLYSSLHKIRNASAATLQENLKLKKEKEELINTLESIGMSLYIHPDCTENSEFRDHVITINELIQKYKEE